MSGVLHTPHGAPHGGTPPGGTPPGGTPPGGTPDGGTPDGAPGAASGPLVPYTFAYLRVVPQVHLGAFMNVGVVLHARTAEFLGLRAVTDADRLARCLPGTDIELLCRYLTSLQAVAAGDRRGGPVALDPPSERFHWLTAPRSDVLRCSPVHVGMTADPASQLDALFAPLAAPPRCG